MTTRWQVDHLVVAAGSIEQGTAWCREVLGVEPGGGGQHLFMGTHNRVLDVSSAAFARCYLEIIAIDPALPSPAHARWFDLDAADLQARLRDGPRLAHWVARCGGIDAAREAMAAVGIDPGAVTAAERGALRWRITVRPDGRRPRGGAAPALIEWAGAHPTDSMRPSGVQLSALSVAAPELAYRLPEGVAVDVTAPIRALLTTPRGPVTLSA